MGAATRVAVTGGGSAGHAVPNLPIIEDLLRQGCDVVYFGSADGPERQIVEPLGITYVSIAVERLRRYRAWSNLLIPFRVVSGVLQSLIRLRQYRPTVLFSKGGFVSVPPVIAAWLLRIPVVIHESDLTPGLANRIAGRFAKTICVALPAEWARYPGWFAKKCITTGIPLRPGFQEADAALADQQFDLERDRPLLFVFGGSAGARSLNLALRAALPALLNRYQIVHICGRGHLDMSLADQSGYLQLEYLSSGIEHLMKRADIILCRAGMTSLLELLALKQPAILVPLSRAASRGDQIDNATLMVEKKLCIQVEDDGLSAETLVEAVGLYEQQVDAMRKQMASVQLLNDATAITAQLFTIRD
ncbi:MAG: UDP-N-acetylglucosamine--N-acetylmuramyl-(pentapeptide) pyrophosphoryl-undecaprenol N-acetylglucosamine transferase [Burkholderiales bacterium]|nr:UDP-N-acetylglucosamine--N-acetylmuramyl-(pentapeptide) pyrophosphoryl-undecaprenol N-acetylglucosamine transferase [Burkholderiales bacterium]